MKFTDEPEDLMMMCGLFVLKCVRIVFALWLTYKVLKGLFYLATQLIEKI